MQKNPFESEFKKTGNKFKDIFSTVDNTFKKQFRSTQKKAAIIIAIVYALLYYYVALPPLNIRSVHSWFYIWSIIAILTLIGGKSLKFYKIYRKLFFGLIVLFLVLQVPGFKFLRAKDYANIINIQDSNFKDDIEELPLDKIPTLDRASSVKLGARKMGELLDLVSQFDIDEDTYTQINYKDNPVRVTPLKYNGFIKYIFNSGEGIPGYIKIDIVNGEAELVKLDDKIKISKEDYFFRDVTRYARLRYPLEIFDDINFEIDENGDPYWVIPTYEPKIFLFDAMDVNGAILINASTGEHKKYNLEEIPQWIDRIYKSDRIIEQLNWNGKLQGGYINSLFAQKNVLQTTEGYNYLALNDDVYLYTGYTSVAADESNVGFILSNQRTKETKFYPVSSAEEFSAMESAEGAVQEKAYRATFPLLLNIKGEPTYFLSLKDNAGLIKLYAFIDAKNYQNVSVGNTVAQAMANHVSDGVIPTEEDTTEYEVVEKEGIVGDIKSVVIKGYTHFYFTLNDDKEEIFIANANLSEKLPFLTSGNRIKFKYKKKNINEVIIIDSISN